MCNMHCMGNTCRDSLSKIKNAWLRRRVQTLRSTLFLFLALYGRINLILAKALGSII